MYLTLLDYVVVFLYLAGIGAIGLTISLKGQKTTSKYFVADKQIPSWAVAFTLMATLISSNTLVAHPAIVFKSSMVLMPGFLLVPFVLVFVAYIVVPFYRRVIGMSAYEYIGKRFGLGGRIFTSSGFIIDRTFDIGVTLVTTGIVVSVMTGWDIKWVLVGVGLFTIVYTCLGGIQAVVWTDVAQGVVLIGGGLLILILLLFSSEAGPPGAVLGEAWRAGKFSFGNPEFSWQSLFNTEERTVWMFLAAMAILWTRRYVCDQNMVQRYLIAKTDSEARKGTLMGAALSVPILLGFNLIGACLYGFYALTDAQPPEIVDHLLPHFVLDFLPAGIVGLLVAAILAASMSSLSSDLNSIATVLTRDYFQRFLPNLADSVHLKIGRSMVFVSGSISIIIGVLIAPTEVTEPLATKALTIATIITTGTLGLFMLGFLSKRATRRGCYIGIGCTLLFMAWALLTSSGHPWFDWMPIRYTMNTILIGIFGQFVMFGTGLLASVLFGGYRPEEIDSLVFKRS